MVSATPVSWDAYSHELVNEVVIVSDYTFIIRVHAFLSTTICLIMLLPSRLPARWP